MVTEKIGKVVLNYAYYSGQDLYSDGEQIENQLLEIVKKKEDMNMFMNPTVIGRVFII